MDIGSWKSTDVDVNIILKKFDLSSKTSKLLFFSIDVFKKGSNVNYGKCDRNVRALGRVSYIN